MINGGQDRRFFPHEEIIEAGEYSDDTQLILCLSRSLLRGEAWRDYFTQIELPFWSAYERGDGGATKRAVDSWLDGIAPWSSNRKPQDVKRYFDAGGNGVAMRILPHVLRFHRAEFPEVAENIFLDGVATHGHPRALVGALAYGFALWAAIRKGSKLAYGELVEELIGNAETWAALPSPPSIQPEWKNQAEKNLQDYTTCWESARDEIMEYLGVCQGELAKGALSLDDDVLKTLQCFNRKISGAGTVAAIASVYLASRHAADPINGVVKASFAIGSDTDTIASMTGGLLGCINGSDWLTPVKQGIQDSAYIEKSAFRLAAGQIDEESTRKPVTRSSLKRWINDVVNAPDSSEVSFPDHRKATVIYGRDHIGRSGKFKVEFRQLTTRDGQRIYLNKISKGSFGATISIQQQARTPHQQPISNSQGSGSKIPAASFEKSVRFYRDCLGLTVKRKISNAIVFDQGIVLVHPDYADAFSQGVVLRALVYVQVPNINECYNRIKRSDQQIISELVPWGQSKTLFFRSLDPDGNIVEVFWSSGQ